jgi:ADP-ribose pyrophosphatase YjhB (NUDIX family)
MVAVGGLVVRENEVLVARPSAKKGIGMWRIPGGIAEPTETLENAVTRHVYEETGIGCKPLAIAGMRYAVRECRCAEKDEMYIVFAARYEEGSPAPGRKGIEEAGFMPIEELLGRNDVVQLTVEMIRSWKEGGGLFLSGKSLHAFRRWNIYEFYTAGGEREYRDDEAGELEDRDKSIFREPQSVREISH